MPRPALTAVAFLALAAGATAADGIRIDHQPARCVVAERFPVDRAFLDAAVDEITGGATAPAGVPAARRTDGPVVPVRPDDWPRSGPDRFVCPSSEACGPQASSPPPL